MNENIIKTLSTQEHQPMEINVNIYPPRKNDTALAAASVCLNGCFVVRGIRIVEGSGGLFVSMPSRQIKDGGKIGYKDTCFPCNEEFRQQFNNAVLDAYHQHKAQEQAQGQTARVPDTSDSVEQDGPEAAP